MGCDIHSYCEVRRPDGTWEKVGKVFEYVWYRPDMPTDVWSCYDENDERIEVGHESGGHGKNCWNRNPMWTDNPWSRRNYDLFAILADVRNGYGFAGIETGGRFEPISAVRGLPVDVSDEVRAESDSWGEDGHSHSWFTVKELMNFGWKEKGNSHMGVVPAKEKDVELEPWSDSFETMQKEGRTKPTAWAGGISGASVVTINQKDAEDKYILHLADVLEKRVYVRVRWKESYYDSCSEFVDKTIGSMARLADDPSDVRMVFWFDN